MIDELWSPWSLNQNKQQSIVAANDWQSNTKEPKVTDIFNNGEALTFG
jgi:hypothetical protein